MADGARFVLNSRYFHIAKPGEIENKYAMLGSHAENLVEYCGTRETVALNFEDNSAFEHSTDNQNKIIQDLVRCVNLSNKDLEEILEYKDYIDKPTKQNASQLIAYLQEQIIMYGTFDEASNLLEYAAKRPGAVKVGEHGLFSSDKNLDLKKAMKDISSHEGNIWTHVLSLRREDADRLGYDSQEPWKNLIKSKLDVIAHNHNIDIADLHWYGAMHNTGTHPHVHLFVFADNNAQKKPYFKENNIKALKSAFAAEIFKEERHNQYVDKHEYYIELRDKSKELLNKLLENPTEYYDKENLNLIVDKMIKLSNKIPEHGSIKYRYMPQNVKSMIDNIQRDLVYKNPILSDLYMQWCKIQYNIEKLYVNDPQQVPVDKNPEFTVIKNEILQQAQKIRNFSLPKHEIINPIVDNTVNSFNQIHIPNEFDFPQEKIEDLIFLATDRYLRTDAVCYKLANCYNYGIGTDIDVASAMIWYGIAFDQYNDSMAAYKLAELYDKGAESIEPDKSMAQYLYAQAFHAFNRQVKNLTAFDAIFQNKEDFEYIVNVSKADSYKEYLIGKMYSLGNGVEQSDRKAFLSFIISEDNGYVSANYELAHMYLNGIGTEVNVEAACECLRKINNQNSDIEYQLGNIYSNKEYDVCNKDTAQEHYTKALQMYIQKYDSEPSGNIAYRVGTMYQYGMGVERDIEEAIKWYKEAVAQGNQKAEEKINSINQQQNVSLMSIATTACHFGRMFNTETQTAFKQQYSNDSKLLHQEKIQKINAGQAVGDRTYDYDY